MADWYDLDFPANSLLTSQKMTRLDGNLDALVEGSAGAPKIQPAAIDSTKDFSFNKLTLPPAQDYCFSSNKATKYLYIPPAAFYGNCFGESFSYHPVLQLDGGASGNDLGTLAGCTWHVLGWAIPAGVANHYAHVPLPVDSTIKSFDVDVYLAGAFSLSVWLLEVNQDGAASSKATTTFNSATIGGTWRSVGGSLSVPVVGNKAYVVRVFFNNYYAQCRLNMVRIGFTHSKILSP